jgi:hypothetical protein
MIKSTKGRGFRNTEAGERFAGDLGGEQGERPVSTHSSVHKMRRGPRILPCTRCGVAVSDRVPENPTATLSAFKRSLANNKPPVGLMPALAALWWAGRQARENRLVYLILAECRLILPEAQAPQPDHDVHASVRN